MNMTIIGILQEFSLDLYRPILPRDLDLGEVLPPRAGNLVKVVSGMRRSGKTYRLFQEMDRLLQMGIPASHICYFNFEDDRVSPATARVGDEVLEAFRYLNRITDPEEGIYLFFDEVQEMAGWGAWLRRIVDTTRATIYITGSSSKMLSREIATEFRGRALDFELLPLSFREFCRQRGFTASQDDVIYASPRQAAMMQSLFDEYLVRGGFPAAIDLAKPQANALLQSYVQRVVSRDVVERHDLGRPRVAMALARRLIGLNARQLSIRKIEQDFRSAGIATGRVYLGDLIDYFEEAYLIFRIKELSRTLSEVTTTQPKVYAIDPGLALANSKAGVSERGQRLENAVYLELRRRHPAERDGAISMVRTKAQGHEVDFAVGDVLDGGPYHLLQVTDTMDDSKVVERECRALWEAMDERGLAEGIIVVGNGERAQYERDGKRIAQIPAWEWMLGRD